MTWGNTNRFGKGNRRTLPPKSSGSSEKSSGSDMGWLRWSAEKGDRHRAAGRDRKFGSTGRSEPVPFFSWLADRGGFRESGRGLLQSRETLRSRRSLRRSIVRTG